MTGRWRIAVRATQIGVCVLAIALLAVVLFSAATTTTDTVWGLSAAGVGLLALVLCLAVACAILRPAPVLAAAVVGLALVDVIETVWAFADNEAVAVIPVDNLVRLLWLGGLALVLATLVGQQRRGAHMAWASAARATALVTAGLIGSLILAVALSPLIAVTVVCVLTGLFLVFAIARRDVERHHWWWPQDSYSVALAVLAVGGFVLIDGLLRGSIPIFTLAMVVTGLALTAAVLLVSRKSGARAGAGLATAAAMALILSGPSAVITAGGGWIDYSARPGVPSPSGIRTATAIDGDGIMRGWVDIVVRRDLVGGLVIKERYVDHISSDDDYIPAHLHWINKTTLAVNTKVLDVPQGRP